MQYGFSGGWKDLLSVGNFMVRSLGVVTAKTVPLSDNMTVSNTMHAFAFSVGTKMIMCCIVIWLAQSVVQVLAVTPIFGVIDYMAWMQCRPGRYSKRRQMLYFVFIEMASYYMVVTAMLSHMGT